MQTKRPPGVWKPAQFKIPPAWRPAPRLSAIRIILSLARNLVPWFGVVKLGWSAQEAVLVGAFNIAMQIVCAFTVYIATPKLMHRSAPALLLPSILWAALSMAVTALLVAGVAYFEGFPLALQLAASKRMPAPDASLVWCVLGVVVVGVSMFMHRLRDNIEYLRETPNVAEKRPLHIGMALLIAIVPLYMAVLLIGLFVAPPKDEVDAIVEITLLAVYSLAFDAMFGGWQRDVQRNVAAAEPG